MAMNFSVFGEREREREREREGDREREIERESNFILNTNIYRKTLGGMKNPIFQSEDIQLEDRQISAGQRTENYNEIMEPAVKYLFLCIMITSILFSLVTCTC